MNPVLFYLALALVLGTAAVIFWKRRERRLTRGLAQVNAAWAELERAWRERVAALEELQGVLEREGYVSEGRARLAEALTRLREASGPRELASANRGVEAVLLQIYRALPRKRPEALRQAQNHLAQADEELDLARTAYNDLVFNWALLLRRFPYRYIAKRRRITVPELCLLPEEDADWDHRHLGPF